MKRSTIKNIIHEELQRLSERTEEQKHCANCDKTTSHVWNDGEWTCQTCGHAYGAIQAKDGKTYSQPGSGLKEAGQKDHTDCDDTHESCKYGHVECAHVKGGMCHDEYRSNHPQTETVKEGKIRGLYNPTESVKYAKKAYGAVWEGASGQWGAKNKVGHVRYFKSKPIAERFAKTILRTEYKGRKKGSAGYYA